MKTWIASLLGALLLTAVVGCESAPKPKSEVKGDVNADGCPSECLLSDQNGDGQQQCGHFITVGPVDFKCPPDNPACLKPAVEAKWEACEAKCCK